MKFMWSDIIKWNSLYLFGFSRYETMEDVWEEARWGYLMMQGTCDECSVESYDDSTNVVGLYSFDNF